MNISRPIGREDVAFYESNLVMVTARSLADRPWETLTSRSRNRYIEKAINIVTALLADKSVVQRLPMLSRNLTGRL